MWEFLRKHKLEIGAPLAIICMVILTITLIFPEGDSVCQKSEYTGNENCSNKYPTVIFLLLSLARDAQDYNGLITALATAIIAWFTLSLMRSTRQNAVATQEAVNTADRSSRNELRAWVSIEFESVVGLETDKHANISMQAFNHGQSPAKNVRHRIGVGVFPDRLPEGFHFPATRYSNSDEPTIFPQSKNHPWVNAGPFNAALLKQIVACTHRLYVWGETEYLDIYGERHTTKFAGSAGGPKFVVCMQAWAWGAKDASRFRFDWRYESKHNDAT